MLTVEAVTDQRRLGPHREEWGRLADAAPEAEVFETPAWITAWLDAYWRERPIMFLFVRDGADLVGMVPLLDDESGRIGCRRSFVTPVNPHVRRCGLLHDGRAAEVLGAAMAHLAGVRRGVRIRLRCCDAASSVAGAVDGCGGRTLVRERGSSPIIRIDGDWDAYLAGRSGHLRHELARKARRLERDWGVEWSTATGPGLDDVLAVECASWKHSAGTSMCSEPGACDFYTRLAADCAAAGSLRLEMLYLDGRPAAHLFGVVHRGVYYAVKTSYDEAFRAWSPGVVLFRRVIERAFGEGLATFDFLGDEAPWKVRLANDERRHVEACVFADDAYRCRWGATLECRVKPFARTHLPGAVALRRRLKDRAAR
ncbi:MAG: GNAT family N-acetyltransferase [Actinobacteria bacterium]|nr:GNAT family N-acetyltransferase [Actinomycetota bacterium]